MKKVGDEVELVISRYGGQAYLPCDVTLQEIHEGGFITLGSADFSIHLTHQQALNLGIEVEIPKKTMWVSNGDPSVAIRAKPPVCNIGEWTKYEEVRD